MIRRQTTDNNFAHCLSLAALSLAGVSFKPGSIVPRGGDTMIELPIELLRAFMEREVATKGPLADACAVALEEAARFKRIQGEDAGQIHASQGAGASIQGDDIA